MFAGFMLVIRRPLLWYYRINEQVENQRKIIELLQSINSKMDTTGMKSASRHQDKHSHQQKVDDPCCGDMK